MWHMLTHQLLSRLIARGALDVRFPDGTRHRYGQGTPVAAMRIANTATLAALLADPDMALGEGYTAGHITLEAANGADEGARLRDTLALFIANRAAGHLPGWARGADGARRAAARLVQRNAPGAARRNVAHHYDLSDDLYARFLDPEMHYSCAYYPHPDMGLEAAQAAKARHIAGKLLLKPGMEVLDIGCGWGAMARHLARERGARMTGITLSQNQLARARARAAAEGLGAQARFRLADYRHIAGRYDRIVSVGMFEHVGLPNYQTYFARIAGLLAENGVALVHTIGRMGPPDANSGWISRHIFPGSHVPSLSQLARPIEQAGLWLTDLEIWRGHYARTLRDWRTRFEAAAPEIEATHGARFIRMWRYYLAACEAGFEAGRLCVFQLQLARRQDAVPGARDYLYTAHAPRGLAAAE